MSFAVYFADWWSFAGFHAAVFAAVVFVLLALQWLMGGRDR
jgi:hypothetical protein